MKKIIILKVLLIFLLINCISISNVISPSRRHEGKWKGILPDKREIMLILDKNGYAKLYLDKNLVLLNNSPNEIYYAIDYTKEPISLDIIFYSEKQSDVIKCIIDFLSETMVRFATNFNHVRPDKFDDNNTTILKKVN
ncbi:MAG TPA: hypothetical protein PLE45_05555 [Spirochaetota bacterium]|nr:hypothetical protein [Spirochaetota bacterium]HOL56529.1 hypothetical protein [Spirochaetota bacterium]HPP03629.1 hypothetical protein [Spirochaetota bacterium]